MGGAVVNDRELLERAAKAAGMETMWDQPRGARNGVLRARYPGSGDAFPHWNPLTDDGDALRLAVKLGLYIEGKFTKHQCVREFVELGELVAVRRAIVRAAAALVDE